METVALKPLRHNGQECIGIYCVQNAMLNHYLQKDAGAKWSRTHKCWHVPLSEKNYQQLAKALSGKAILQIDELKKYLLEKKKHNPDQSSSYQNKTVAGHEPGKSFLLPAEPAMQLKYPHTLCKENKEALQQFNRELVLKGYSK